MFEPGYDAKTVNLIRLSIRELLCSESFNKLVLQDFDDLEKAGISNEGIVTVRQFMSK
jgi:hypothetical protein